MTRKLSTLAQSLLGVALATGLLGAAPSASAQQTATVTVPFAFSVNHYNLPAGSYKVDLSSPVVVSLVNLNTQKAAGIYLIRKDQGQAIETRGRLTFRRTARGMALTEVWMAGSSSHGELAIQPRSIREMEVAGSTPTPTLVEIAMK